MSSGSCGRDELARRLRARTFLTFGAPAGLSLELCDFWLNGWDICLPVTMLPFLGQRFLAIRADVQSRRWNRMVDLFRGGSIFKGAFSLAATGLLGIGIGFFFAEAVHLALAFAQLCFDLFELLFEQIQLAL